jgi:hypothetical protein
MTRVHAALFFEVAGFSEPSVGGSTWLSARSLGVRLSGDFTLGYAFPTTGDLILASPSRDEAVVLVGASTAF